VAVRGMVVLLLVPSRPRTMSAFGGGSAAGPSHSRRSQLVRETVAKGEQQTLTCTSAEWLGSV
jgi:hypothetical protein